MSRQDDFPPAALEEAMDWLLLLREKPQCPETKAAFEAWFAATVNNRLAWQQACRTWRLMGDVPPAFQHLWPENANPAPVELPRRRPAKWRSVAALALAAGLVAAIAAPGLLVRLQADHATATGESRVVTLGDGTTIHLAADTAIDTDLSGTTRRVTLLAGEAFFDVAHDAARPFRVDAGGVDVAVLGTAFDVRFTSRQTVVELARGAVRVTLPRADDAVSASLAPGEMMTVDRDTGTMVKNAVDPADIGSWRNGRLFVQDATVASVVEQIQRYHPAWIALPDRTLASKRVTGLYDLTDPDRALRALVEPHGGRVRSVSPYGRLLTSY